MPELVPFEEEFRAIVKRFNPLMMAVNEQYRDMHDMYSSLRKQAETPEEIILLRNKHPDECRAYGIVVSVMHACSSCPNHYMSSVDTGLYLGRGMNEIMDRLSDSFRESKESFLEIKREFGVDVPSALQVCDDLVKLTDKYKGKETKIAER